MVSLKLLIFFETGRSFGLDFQNQVVLWFERVICMDTLPKSNIQDTSIHPDSYERTSPDLMELTGFFHTKKC